MKKIFNIIPLVFIFILFSNLSAQTKQDYSLNILIIGAHPDDADAVGGTAYKWIQQGHKVTLVSVTNGNAGHHILNPEELERTRREEARRAGEVIGARYIVMDVNDGQMVPSLENRFKIIRLIREFKADIVISHRPYTYHPDHRYTGTLVLDAAYMVAVPLILPEVPPLKSNPVFLYLSDGFTDPSSFSPDVCVDIDGDPFEKHLDMNHEHKSQWYEWLPFIMKLEQVPETDKERREWIGEWFKSQRTISPLCREKLIELYGEERGRKIKYADCFQDSGYGTRLTKENVKFYFPFFD